MAILGVPEADDCSFHFIVRGTERLETSDLETRVVTRPWRTHDSEDGRLLWF